MSTPLSPLLWKSVYYPQYAPRPFSLFSLTVQQPQSHQQQQQAAETVTMVGTPSSTTVFCFGETGIEANAEEANQPTEEEPHLAPVCESATLVVPDVPEEWAQLSPEALLGGSEELLSAVGPVSHGNRGVWEERWACWSSRVVFPYERDRAEYDANAERYPPNQPVVVRFNPYFVRECGRKLKLADGMLQLGFLPTKYTRVFVRDEVEARLRYRNLTEKRNEQRKASRKRSRAAAAFGGEVEVD